MGKGALGGGGRGTGKEVKARGAKFIRMHSSNFQFFCYLEYWRFQFAQNISHLLFSSFYRIQILKAMEIWKFGYIKWLQNGVLCIEWPMQIIV